MKRFLLVSHYTLAAGPVQKLDAYLRKNKKFQVTTIYHPLFPNINLPSRIVNSRNTSFSYKIPFAQYCFEVIVNYWFLKSKANEKYFDAVICFDPLSYFYCFLLRLFFKFKINIYFNVDFSRKRFINGLLNFIYQRLNLFAYANCDYFFAITYNFVEAIDPKNTIKPKSRIFRLKHTFDINELKKRKNIHKINHSLIFIGSFYYSLEFETLFQALAELKKKEINFVFHLYGSGNLHAIKNLIEKYSLKKEVKIKQAKPYSELISTVLPQYQIGVCPYDSTRNQSKISFVQEADDLTTKMVDYISCGLPFITTLISPKLKFIEDEKIGFVVLSKTEWINLLKQLLTDKNLYKKLSRNTLAFAKKYDGKKVYGPIFKQILLENSL